MQPLQATEPGSPCNPSQHTFVFPLSWLVEALTGASWHAAGAVYTKPGRAEAGSPLLEHTREELADCEGLVVRVRGDGQVYSMILTTGGVITCNHM